MEKYYKKWFKILNIPAIILFVVVILVPFIMGVAYSFTAWRGSYFKGSEHWYGALVGFKNYIKVFHSQKFITSFVYTIKFTVVAVVIKNIVSLGMALINSAKAKDFSVPYFSSRTSLEDLQWALSGALSSRMYIP